MTRTSTTTKTTASDALEEKLRDLGRAIGCPTPSSTLRDRVLAAAATIDADA
jgi:hypothetical protein